MKKSTPTSAIVWFRQDLRLDDNSALQAAVAHGSPVIPVFIWDPEVEGEWAPGGASRVWLHGSLRKLDESLRAQRSRLILRQGNSLDVLLQLLRETKAKTVCWNRRYEPALVARDRKIEQTLAAQGVHVETFNSLLLFEPWTVQTKSSKPYKIFTPFYRACRALPEPECASRRSGQNCVAERLALVVETGVVATAAANPLGHRDTPGLAARRELGRRLC